MRARRWFDRLRGFAHAPGDSDEVTFEKVLILVVALSCMMCGVAWSLMYWVVFGVGLTMALPALFEALSVSVPYDYRGVQVVPAVFRAEPRQSEWADGTSLQSGTAPDRDSEQAPP